MVDFINDFISNVFKDNVWLGVLFIAAIPIIELKGAIPFALSPEFWGVNALNIYEAFLYSYIGSIIPAFFIIFLLKPVFNWMKKFKLTRKLVLFFEERFKRLGEKIKQRTKNAPLSKGESLTEEELALIEQEKNRKTERKKFWGILIFIAIPLPMTGVWTGSAISVFMGMKANHSLPAVLIGNFIAGIFVSLVCMIFDSYLIIFFIVVGVFLLAFIFSLTKSLVKKARKKKI